MKKIAFALLLGTVFAVGCGDKGGDGAKSGAAASGSAKAAGSSAAGSSGSKVCDDYWTKLKACNEASLKAMPDGDAKTQAKKAMDDAEKASKDAWKEVKGEALDSACKTAMDALANNPACPK